MLDVGCWMMDGILKEGLTNEPPHINTHQLDSSEVEARIALSIGKIWLPPL
jgi:hypothetical protein